MQQLLLDEQQTHSANCHWSERTRRRVACRIQLFYT